MARVRKDPATRRLEFIDASMDLFCSKGYEQTMVQDICRAVGVAKGTFFYYFPTKEDVLRAIFEHWTRRFVEDFLSKGTGKDAVQKLRLFLGMSAGENSIEPLVDKLLAEQQGELVRQLWQRIVEQSFNCQILRIFEQGNQEGTMRVEHGEESLDFFWSLMDAVWPDEKKDTITDESMVIREMMFSMLMEQLLHMEAGSLKDFKNTV